MRYISCDRNLLNMHCMQRLHTECDEKQSLFQFSAAGVCNLSRLLRRYTYAFEVFKFTENFSLYTCSCNVNSKTSELKRADTYLIETENRFTKRKWIHDFVDDFILQSQEIKHLCALYGITWNDFVRFITQQNVQCGPQSKPVYCCSC